LKLITRTGNSSLAMQNALAKRSIDARSPCRLRIEFIMFL
jgi:hypothetical protein